MLTMMAAGDAENRDSRGTLALLFGTCVLLVVPAVYFVYPALFPEPAPTVRAPQASAHAPAPEPRTPAAARAQPEPHRPLPKLAAPMAPTQARPEPTRPERATPTEERILPFRNLEIHDGVQRALAQAARPCIRAALARFPDVAGGMVGVKAEVSSDARDGTRVTQVSIPPAGKTPDAALHACLIETLPKADLVESEYEGREEFWLSFDLQVD